LFARLEHTLGQQVNVVCPEQVSSHQAAKGLPLSAIRHHDGCILSVLPRVMRIPGSMMDAEVLLKQTLLKNDDPQNAAE
jgi:hypothetical protein